MEKHCRYMKEANNEREVRNVRTVGEFGKASGAFRKKSEKYGAVAYLCHTCHNEPPNGVHFNRFMRLTLQEQTQRKLMEIYGWNIERFIEIFGKNYL